MIRPKALPTRTAKALLWTRRLCAAGAVATLTLGMLSCADELNRNLKTPPNTLSAWSGTAVSFSGTFEGDCTRAKPLLRAHTSPDTNLIAVNSLDVVPRNVLGGCRWRATLTALPQLPPGRIDVTLTAISSNNIETPLDPWTIVIYRDAEEARAASHSLLERRLGLNPLLCALIFLGFSLFFAAATPILGRLFSRNLSEHGYLLVYYTKTDGDDTLLYCLDSKRLLEADRTYPVLSAIGQMLGLAAMTLRGRRHCVLRLPAAQARAGCLIALRAN